MQNLVDCSLEEVRLVFGADVLDTDDKTATEMGITDACTLIFVRVQGLDDLRLSVSRKLFMRIGEVRHVGPNPIRAS